MVRVRDRQIIPIWSFWDASNSCYLTTRMKYSAMLQILSAPMAVGGQSCRCFLNLGRFVWLVRAEPLLYFWQPYFMHLNSLLLAISLSPR